MRRTTPIALLFTLLTVASCAESSGGELNSQGIPGTLRVGVIPNEAPDEQRARYAPLAEYLGQKLQTEVELFVASDYAGVISALAADKVDIAYVGGLTYAQALEQTDVEPLVSEVDQETGTQEYLSAIVVRDDSPHQTTEEIVEAGETFAFGDVGSTSGSLYPRMMLNDAGANCSAEEITDCSPLERVSFTGGHDATAQAVANGSAGAGGLELRILHRLEEEGHIPEGELRVVEERPVMGYLWVMRSGLGDEAADSVRETFESLEDPELLDLMQTSEYRPVDPSDYDEIKESAEELGLTRADL
ncbi:phosphate/phosphite/phosphonate ABC transporter substrate-binding protein [Nocardiopsis baichengensis]|uniref:phosphate/phosphite/phosphonate ABC transporter substrate-binding protein n=1 Tax=Nocardiopsis baichengensis TaxID=280240 RepID=UPI0003465C4A|nr:phosphate/phosphite/phosphonate ABC transporter substrate-binding protein [Nocardiopsis baichengensis]